MHNLREDTEYLRAKGLLVAATQRTILVPEFFLFLVDLQPQRHGYFPGLGLMIRGTQSADNIVTDAVACTCHLLASNFRIRIYGTRPAAGSRLETLVPWIRQVYPQDPFEYLGLLYVILEDQKYVYNLLQDFLLPSIHASHALQTQPTSMLHDGASCSCCSIE